MWSDLMLNSMNIWQKFADIDQYAMQKCSYDINLYSYSHDGNKDD